MTSRQVYCLLLAAEQSQGCSTDLREGLLTDQPRNRTRAQYCAIETSLCPLSRSRQAKRGSPGTYSTRRPDGRRCQRWKIMKTRPLLHTTGEEEEDKLGSCQEGRGLRLLDADGRMYMDLNCKGASIFWRPTFCSNCGKPKITHPRISRVCSRASISQVLKGKYELVCMSNLVMEMAADNLAAKTKEERNQAQSSDGGAAPADTRRYDIRTKL